MDAAYTIVTLADPFSPNPVVREIGAFCYLMLEAERNTHGLIPKLRKVIERIRCIEGATWERCCEVPQHEVIDKFESLVRCL